MSVEHLLSKARVLMSALISFAFSTFLPTILSNRLWEVNFTRDIVPTCVVDTSNERCENGEHIQDEDSVFPLAAAVSRWHYF